MSTKQKFLIVYLFVLAVALLFIYRCADAQIPPEDYMYQGAAGGSDPYCPDTKMYEGDPERYYFKEFKREVEGDKQRCIEVIDRKQEDSWGGTCKVDMKCDAT